MLGNSTVGQPDYIVYKTPHMVGKKYTYGHEFVKYTYRHILTFNVELGKDSHTQNYLPYWIHLHSMGEHAIKW